MLKVNVHLTHRDWNQYLYHLFSHTEHTLNNKQLLSQTFRINSFLLRKISLESSDRNRKLFLIDFLGKEIDLEMWNVSFFSKENKS